MRMCINSLARLDTDKGLTVTVRVTHGYNFFLGIMHNGSRIALLSLVSHVVPYDSLGYL